MIAVDDQVLFDMAMNLKKSIAFYDLVSNIFMLRLNKDSHISSFTGKNNGSKWIFKRETYPIFHLN